MLSELLSNTTVKNLSSLVLICNYFFLVFLEGREYKVYTVKCSDLEYTWRISRNGNLLPYSNLLRQSSHKSPPSQFQPSRDSHCSFSRSVLGALPSPETRIDSSWSHGLHGVVFTLCSIQGSWNSSPLSIWYVFPDGN